MGKLSIDSVSKWRTVRTGNGERERVPVLADVTLVLPDAEITAIVGPSGSGKSTLLRLLNRLEEPDEGTIELDGKPIREMDTLALRRRVGTVFQQPVMLDGTAAANVAYGPDLAGEDTPPERCRELLELVGLPGDYTERDAQRLSVGEQQRVAIARTLANEPDVLLLDEPTSALDPGSSRRVLDAVRAANVSLGVTVVLVSHTIDHARLVAAQAAVLVGGRLIEAGEATKVLHQPETDAAKRFLAGELEAGEG